MKRDKKNIIPCAKDEFANLEKFSFVVGCSVGGGRAQHIRPRRLVPHSGEHMRTAVEVTVD